MLLLLLKITPGVGFLLSAVMANMTVKLLFTVPQDFMGTATAATEF